MRRYVFWINDLLLSSCCAFFGLLLLASQGPSLLIGQLGRPIWMWEQLLRPYYPSLRFGRGPDRGLYMAWCVLSLIFFACLRLAGRSALIGAFLCRLAGPVAVAGLPLFHLIFNTTNRFSTLGRPVSPMWTTFLWLEVLVAVTSAVVFAYGRRLMIVVPSVIVLLLHFGLWYWWLVHPWGGDYFVYTFALTLSAGTSVVWGFRIKLFGASNRPLTTLVER